MRASKNKTDKEQQPRIHRSPVQLHVAPGREEQRGHNAFPDRHVTINENFENDAAA